MHPGRDWLLLVSTNLALTVPVTKSAQPFCLKRMRTIGHCSSCAFSWSLIDIHCVPSPPKPSPFQVSAYWAQSRVIPHTGTCPPVHLTALLCTLLSFEENFPLIRWGRGQNCNTLKKVEHSRFIKWHTNYSSVPYSFPSYSYHSFFSDHHWTDAVTSNVVA